MKLCNDYLLMQNMFNILILCCFDAIVVMFIFIKSDAENMKNWSDTWA